MPRGGNKPTFTAAQVAEHSRWQGKDKDAWLVYDGRAYDFSRFVARHPGGNVLVTYAGQDATTVMDAFHPDAAKLKKYLRPLEVGAVVDAKQAAVVDDFVALQDELRRDGYFDSNKLFYIAALAHIVLLEYAAWALVKAGYGFEHGGLLAYWGVALLLATAQAQAGWLQHDFGHLSVFKNYWANYFAHQFTIAHLKGAGKWWWTSRHQRHHAKPNVIDKDPDIDTTLPMFLFGDAYFDSGKWFFRRLIPFQKYTWFLFGPPVVTTLLFVAQNLWYAVQRRRYWDLVWVLSYFVRYGAQYGPLIGGWECVKLYFAMRFIETHWFTWVTSMNHLPMKISKDTEKDWVTLQCETTQNVSPGYFNDWFCGHLNYQIEHHLMPTMPRHNYPLVAPRVRALCERHGIEYRCHSMWQSCVDIVQKLDVVGHAYEEHLQMNNKNGKSNKKAKSK